MGRSLIMGYFYFDETIQQKAGFIIGAFIYSENDLTPSVFASIEKVGLQPKIDEFKSGARMKVNLKQVELRNALSNILLDCQTGLVVIPVEKRDELGNEAINALSKFLTANQLENAEHHIYFDEAILVDAEILKDLPRSNYKNC